MKSLEKSDRDKAIQDNSGEEKRDQALKDADRLNQQLTELGVKGKGSSGRVLRLWLSGRRRRPEPML